MANHRFRDPVPATPLIAPSILSADFACLAADAGRALDAGGDLLHIDIMDGHFVPNLTMGPALVRSLRSAMPDVMFDVHLMVADPIMFIEPFAEAGADHCTVHIEACVNESVAPAAVAETIHDACMTAGLAINPPTDVDLILPHLDAFDLILVMSVNPGFSGQSFIDSVLEKTALIRNHLRDDQWLEMDGGISRETASACIDAGTNVLAVASAIFKSNDYVDAIKSLRIATGRPPVNEPA